MYGDPENHTLQHAIAAHHGVDPANIMVGEGIDGLFGYVVRMFVEPGDSVVTSQGAYPTFNYHVVGYDGQLVTVPYCNDREDGDALLAAAAECQAKLIYLANPDNPMGTWWGAEKVDDIIARVPAGTLLVLDEAYGEFSDYSVVNLVKNNDNLIVIRTFSKAFGLAGLRLGYFVANKRFTDIFSRVIQYPYPLNSLAIEVGILALQKSKQISSIFSLIKKERERVIKNLRSYDIFDVFNSKANYVLFDAKSSDSRVYNALTEQGISIRKLGKLGKHNGCLRVTIGTKEMNSKFLLAIRDLVR